jgi:hypothetical protein
MSLRRWSFENSLSLFFFAIFAVTIAAQSIAGQRALNEEHQAHGEAPLGWWHYVTSADFGQAVMENWQSEVLQFFLFILATIWLVQKGSNESKPVEDAGGESDEQQKVGAHAPKDAPRWARMRGWRLRLYENSLLLVMLTIFLLSWLAQSLTAWRTFNEEQREHDEAVVSWGRYVLEPDFWERTLQNWQSEFLAVGSMAILSVYLRQRGSPESKPVGASHEATGIEG